MSVAEGTKEFKKLLKGAMDKSRTYQALQKNFREKLNTENIHILDISRNALIVNATTEDQKSRFDDSYNLLLDTIEKVSTNITKFDTLSDLKAANPGILTTGTIYVRSPAMLLCPSFTAARRFVTKSISQAIPSDEFFGITNRARTIDELRSEGYEVTPINPDNVELGWRIRSLRSGRLRSKPRYFDNQGYELVDKGSSIRRVRELSNLDIGHTYTKSAKDAPLGFKLTRLLNVRDISPSTKKVVDDAITELLSLQGEVGFDYKNNLPEGLSKGGYLNLTLEFYTINGAKAKVETEIYNRVKAEIINEIKSKLLSIPGSNTMLEDTAEILKQTLVASIRGVKLKVSLPKHGNIKGSATSTPKVKKVSTSSRSLTIGSSPRYSNVTDKEPKSLVELQLLINNLLPDVISANMGDGDSKRILNYRTGRFAASASVERMSQSRAGMITAFYTYMKYPYQTFEPGYRQGSPKTRDPKLLISQSIKEIAATRVANRMRAVLV